MDTKTAKQVITEAMDIAISRGCFNLIQVNNIVKSLEIINALADIKFEDITEE
jgi:hypothetical protein